MIKTSLDQDVLGNVRVRTGLAETTGFIPGYGVEGERQDQDLQVCESYCVQKITPKSKHI